VLAGVGALIIELVFVLHVPWTVIYGKLSSVSVGILH